MLIEGVPNERLYEEYERRSGKSAHSDSQAFYWWVLLAQTNPKILAELRTPKLTTDTALPFDAVENL